jgi:RND family efflux transporter MFP subunit
VRVAAVEAVDGPVLGLSATLRARVEAPLAFQVGGRITARRVDVGQRVRAGAVLFELDPADLAEAVRAAEAERKAADSAFATAQADFQRLRDLQARGFVSEQALDRARLAMREAESRRDAAQARWAQALNARAYARLVSPAQGVVVEVRAEPGQVVAAGQTVALLARDGPREVELFFPDGVAPPQSGEVVLPDGTRRVLELREAAPAVEPLARTRRARYAVHGELPADLALGSVLAARFPVAAAHGVRWRVPLAALDERGKGARVWRVRAGHAEPVPVQVETLGDTHAVVSGPLAAGEEVIALGVHLLHAGMAVEARSP